MLTPPILWSIAGMDTAGGAGLSADQRAADALGVHLCPVTACLTAQNSQGVSAIFPVPAEQLEAQLQALADDMPPRAIKTGLLGSVAAIEAVAQWVDRLRAQTPAGGDPHRQLALVVDPVLRASAGGAAFTNGDIIEAYRRCLLPRATLLTPNRREALALLGHADESTPAFDNVPDVAEELMACGARSVLITGGDSQETSLEGRFSLDWLHTPQAHGWLCGPRVNTPHHHGTGCTLASALAAALAIGHVEADACVLARMVVHHALTHARQAGKSRGPVIAALGALTGPTQGGAPLPWLGIGRELPWRLLPSPAGAKRFPAFHPPADRLYGILPDGPSLTASVDAGMRCVQLRHKAFAGAESALAASVHACARLGATLFVNDHCPWELARALGCGPSYVACGPVQGTTTKDMPWLPQGEHNLRWWIAQSDVPVVAIGGLLSAEDLRRFAACGPAALCVVRALQAPNHELAARLSGFRQATRHGAAGAAVNAPTPCLPNTSPLAKP
jgi:hydroxymethylpyrimidine kinase/phosphomethylpyrimidine kinase/thiamine-phosphate diphosphorylase